MAEQADAPDKGTESDITLEENDKASHEPDIIHGVEPLIYGFLREMGQLHGICVPTDVKRLFYIFYNGRFRIKKKVSDTPQGHIYIAEDLFDDMNLCIVREAVIDLCETGKSHDGKPFNGTFLRANSVLKYLSSQPNADSGFTRMICDWQNERCYYYAAGYSEKELFTFISESFQERGRMKQYMETHVNKPQVVLTENNAHQWLIDVRGIFRQLVKAVHYFHQNGVCHLDLSLESTMIYEVEGLKVKICGFGLAKQFDLNEPSDALFKNEGRVGKRGYMAPEVFNSMVYDCRKADIWSLGTSDSICVQNPIHCHFHIFHTHSMCRSDVVYDVGRCTTI